MSPPRAPAGWRPTAQPRSRVLLNKLLAPGAAAIFRLRSVNIARATAAIAPTTGGAAAFGGHLCCLVARSRLQSTCQGAQEQIRAPSHPLLWPVIRCTFGAYRPHLGAPKHHALARGCGPFVTGTAFPHISTPAHSNSLSAQHNFVATVTKSIAEGDVSYISTTMLFNHCRNSHHCVTQSQSTLICV